MRFLAFGGHVYYASGGALDFLGEYSEYVEAVWAVDAYVDESPSRLWAHVAELDIDGHMNITYKREEDD